MNDVEVELFSLQLQHSVGCSNFFQLGKIFVPLVFYLLLKNNYWYNFERILLALQPFNSYVTVNKSKNKVSHTSLGGKMIA